MSASASTSCAAVVIEVLVDVMASTATPVGGAVVNVSVVPEMS